MTAAALVALAVVGVAVGFLAGLIGIGGGVFTVPFLYFFYSHESFSGVHLLPALHATVAHATSLFIIVPTAAGGTATYARSHLVEWRAAVPVAMIAIVGAVLGALIAARVPGQGLKVGFGVFLIASGLQLLMRRRGGSEPGPLRVTLPAVGATGMVMGVFSALLGVGGGLIGIPLLLHVLRVQMERVAATSLAIIAIAAASGTVTYVATGQSETAMQLGPLGYVHLAVALPMLPGAVLAVRWGARLNQRLDPKLLRLTFAAVFTLTGLWIVFTNVGGLV
jgi:uncharacterized membrane protein YfcA